MNVPSTSIVNGQAVFRTINDTRMDKVGTTSNIFKGTLPALNLILTQQRVALADGIDEGV